MNQSESMTCITSGAACATRCRCGRMTSRTGGADVTTCGDPAEHGDLPPDLAEALGGTRASLGMCRKHLHEETQRRAREAQVRQRREIDAARERKGIVDPRGGSDAGRGFG
jgi:hypothetical protein